MRGCFGGGERRRTTANRGEPFWQPLQRTIPTFKKNCVYFFYILGLVDKVCRFPALNYMIEKHSKTFAMLFLPEMSNAGVLW